MQEIDIAYLQNEIAKQAAQQLQQLIQNKGEAIVEAINKQLDEAEEEDDVIFNLSHAIKIDLTDMNIKGKLSFAVKSSTELKTAIMDPENPELDFGAAGTGDSGAPDVPEGDPMEGRDVDSDGICNKCGQMFEEEVEAEDHINGPACKKPE